MNKTFLISGLILIITALAYFVFTNFQNSLLDADKINAEQSTLNSSQYNYSEISAKSAKEMADTNPNLIIIDVSPNYEQGHIPGAVNYYISDGSLDRAIPTLDKNKDYLVYCHSETAAMMGAEKLEEAGFDSVYLLKGNYSAWVDAGYETETI